MGKRITAVLYGIILFAGGALLLVSGGQRLAAALLVLPTDAVKERIGAGETIPVAELDRAIDNLSAAERWHTNPDHYTDRALFELVRYEQYRLTGREGAASLARARRDLDNALKLGHLNPYAWVRLAYVFTLSPGPSIASSKALERSFLTGPMDRKLALIRYELALANWSVLSDPTRALMQHEAQLIWRGALDGMNVRSPSRRRLISSALIYNKIDWSRDLVVNDKRDRVHFEAILRQERNRNQLQVTIDAEEAQP